MPTPNPIETPALRILSAVGIVAAVLMLLL